MPRMPSCHRCGKHKPRYKGSTLCRACYQYAKSKRRAKETRFSLK